MRILEDYLKKNYASFNVLLTELIQRAKDDTLLNIGEGVDKYGVNLDELTNVKITSNKFLDEFAELGTEEYVNDLKKGEEPYNEVFVRVALRGIEVEVGLLFVYQTLEEIDESFVPTVNIVIKGKIKQTFSIEPNIRTGSWCIGDCGLNAVPTIEEVYGMDKDNNTFRVIESIYGM